MPNSGANNILQQLVRNTNIIPKFCDSCGFGLGEDDVQLVGQKANVVSCRSHCPNCGATHILNISMPVNGVGMATRAPLNIDLSTAGEFQKFAGKSAVTANDAIDTYNSLSKVNSLKDFMKALDSKSKQDL